MRTLSDLPRLSASFAEFREQWPRLGEFVDQIELCFYDVVHVAAG
jgi:hypothetical protein